MFKAISTFPQSSHGEEADGQLLSSDELVTVHGGQSAPPDPGVKIRDAGDSWVDVFAPFVKPILKTGDAIIETGNWVRYQAEHVPSLNMTEKEIDDYQARLEQAEAQKEQDAAEERERLISGDKEPTKEEVKEYIDTVNGSGGSAPPANSEPYAGDVAIPPGLANAPAYEPQIYIEPLDASY